MDKNQQNDRQNLFHLCLPYGVAILGIGLAVAVWYSLVDDIPSAKVIASIEESFPWVVLVLGISLAILAGFAIRLIQLTRQRKKSFEVINENFKKEMADRILAEETKQELEKALLQGQKLQAIGTLAGGIAHDFNNLLYAIMGYVEMARDDVLPESLTYKNLGKVLDASKKGQELVARILAFSRRQHHDFHALNLKSTVENVLALLTPTIPASVGIQLGNIPENWQIQGNQTQLHQVIVNIINNAVDAMDGEGHVKFTFERIAPSNKLLKQNPKASSGYYYKIAISDTGHGMDQATMQRIFEPFFTTKEVGKGTGLGLATVHSIMEEHKGSITVESQLGHGATFTLLLPEYQEEGEQNGKNFIS